MLPSCHGAWTMGGIVGAVVTLATGDVPWSAVALVAVLPLAGHGGAVPRSRPRRSATTTETDVPWRAIVMVGLALVVFYTVDTAAATWGPVYLDDVFDAPEDLVALATLPYLVASGVVRLVGDRLTEQVGAVRLVRVGAAIALVALTVVVAAPSWPVAVLGFTLLGCGVAVVAPLSFSAAAALAGRDADPATRRARVDAVVARFNQFNYAGALLGAVMTGAVGAGSLRIGFAVPLVLVVALFWLAKAFAPADEVPAGARRGLGRGASDAAATGLAAVHRLGDVLVVDLGAVRLLPRARTVVRVVVALLAIEGLPHLRLDVCVGVLVGHEVLLDRMSGRTCPPPCQTRQAGSSG